MTEGHLYTVCYCEENIYHLAQLHPEAFVVFISNESRSVPFWLNKARMAANPAEGGLVIWDYHVILVDPEKNTMWDFDSAVPFPCPIDRYLSDVLKMQHTVALMERFRRLYRIVKASEYVRGFASDRSHMLDENNLYLSPVPAYPAIVSENGERMNLVELFTLDASDISTSLLDNDMSDHGLRV